MDLQTFNASLDTAAPPTGDWDKAHELAQQEPDPIGAWVHAYLHRVEGDESNAGYWYNRAQKPHSKAALPEEWDQIATALLAG